MAEAEVVLITGCASGIGKALARDLNRRQTPSGGQAYKVYATDFRIEPLAELAKEGIRTLYIDVTNMASIHKAVDAVLDENKHIDLLVCSAGLYGRGFLADMDYSIIEKAFAVNVHGAFKVAQTVSPHMMARRSGKIGIVCGTDSYLARPFLAATVGSKAAALTMTEALAMELHHFGITVTSIIPGYVKSDYVANSLTESERYSTPSSPYHSYYSGVVAKHEKLHHKGTSCGEAARLIGDGLSQATTPRFLYVGSGYRMTFFLAFIQDWVFNGLIARMLKSAFGLTRRYVPQSYTNGTSAKTQKGE